MKVPKLIKCYSKENKITLYLKEEIKFKLTSKYGISNLSDKRIKKLFIFKISPVKFKHVD